MSGLVRVALPKTPDELYTYRVPEGCGAVAPGTRVLVPFGTRRVTGLVVEAGRASDVAADKLRSLELVLESEPSLPAPLIELARFVAEYYLCPLGEVLRAMAPAGPAGRLVVRLTDAGRLAVAGAIRGKRQRAVLEALAGSDSLTLEGLRRRSGVGAGGALLRDLQERGWLELSERLSRAPRAQALRVFEALPPTEDEDAALGRSSVRREVLAELRERGERLTADELAGRTGRPRGSVLDALGKLAKAGLAREHERRVMRRPEAPEGDAAQAARDALRPLGREQARAVEDAQGLVAAGEFAVLLVEGITGSGKTEVYLRALAQAIECGRTGLYLVPEIAITPLLLRALRARFGERTAVLHSGLSNGERHDERERIRSGEVDLVVGARSAVFAPLPRLGLIVVDEEHEGSYKQDGQPRYHGRDVAVVRGRLEGVPVLLGSATPSLESYRNALEGRYRLRRMTERAGDANTATVEIVDMREESRANPKGGPLSRRLRESLDATLAAGKQAMLLLNRRGWADFLLCRECGEPERCDHCAVTLTVHLKAGELACHYCDLRRSIPEKCRNCAGDFLQNVGQGTERLEAELKALLPDVGISRLDADVARRKGAAARVLAEFEAGKSRVLLGTQMIAKGHDFPGVTLVGVLQADRALWLPDFRAAERTFQLITQVAGRAGRRSDPGLVVVQSYSPEHPALQLAAKQEYAPFYETEAATREALGYPPFARLIGVLVHSEDRERAREHAAKLGAALRERLAGGGVVLGPAPAPLARLRDRWRFHCLLKSLDRRRLREAVRAALRDAPAAEEVGVEVDVDPISLL